MENLKDTLPITNLHLFNKSYYGYTITYDDLFDNIHRFVKEGFINDELLENTTHYYLFDHNNISSPLEEGIELIWEGNPFNLTAYP